MTKQALARRRATHPALGSGDSTIGKGLISRGLGTTPCQAIPIPGRNKVHCSGVHQPLTHGVMDQFGEVGQSEFLQDARLVGADGL